MISCSHWGLFVFVPPPFITLPDGYTISDGDMAAWREGKLPFGGIIWLTRK